MTKPPEDDPAIDRQLTQLERLIDPEPPPSEALSRISTSVRRLARYVNTVPATPETLLARLGDCLSRPLLHKLDPDARVERLRSILAERRDAYESAAVRVDTDDLAVDAIVDRVCRELDALADSPLEREG